MITKLKMNSGMAQFKNIEGMITDLMTAKEDTKLFEESSFF